MYNKNSKKLLLRSIVVFIAILTLVISIPLSSGISVQMNGLVSFETNNENSSLALSKVIINPYIKSSSIACSNYDRSGYSIAGIGDINNDTFDDIAIGVPYNDDGGIDAGQVFLFFGKASGWSQDTLFSQANASFIGEAPGDNAGFSVSGAGDVNKDGIDDFLVGAIGNDEGKSNENIGQTYLIFGKASGWTLNTSLSQANASFWGPNSNSYSGNAVAGVGDVNNDTYDDFLIGAYLNDLGAADDDIGTAYLFFGKSSGWSIDDAITNADVFLFGEMEGDEFGFDVAGAGDINNDTYDDFFISAPSNNEGGTLAGKSYLFFGNTTSFWTLNPVLNASKANASFIGESSNDQSGMSILGAGDVNNDQFDDLLITAPSNEEGGVGFGQTYLIFGKATNNWVEKMNLTNANASFIGEAQNDFSGWSIAAADINNDAYSDILIGATLNDEGGENAGQTYVIYGKASEWSQNTSLSQANASFIGEKPGDYSGWSVANAGDINNDTYDDLLIGAIFNDEGGNDNGQTYLVLGRASDLALDTSLAEADASFRYYSKSSPRFPFILPPEEPVEIPGYPALFIISVLLVSILTIILMKKRP